MRQVPNEEILIVVSSLARIAELQIPFVFTDQHAYPAMANYYTDLGDLSKIDWTLLNQVAVGIRISPYPPHRSGRADFPHPALASGGDAQTALGGWPRCLAFWRLGDHEPSSTFFMSAILIR